MEKVPVISNALSDMFKLQKEIVNDYIQLEGLPNYPVDIHSREGQKVLKSFSDRFIEELAEGFQELAWVCHYVANNKNEQAVKCLINYNMEIADAWHFMLEFLIFAGYGNDEKITDLLRKWAQKEDNQKFDNMVSNLYPLKAMMVLGDFSNQENGKGILRTNPGAYRVVDEDTAIKEPDTTGGRRINSNLFEDHQALLWLVSYAMKMVTNSLTNRDHHQTEKEVNLIEFEYDIAQTLIQWGTYLSFAGFTEISMFNCYREKNYINQQRIKTGY